MERMYFVYNEKTNMCVETEYANIGNNATVVRVERTKCGPYVDIFHTISEYDREDNSYAISLAESNKDMYIDATYIIGKFSTTLDVIEKMFG